jgi:peroxiredoxin
MSQAVQTLDGWFVLHDFRSIDWSAWKAASDADRSEALEDLIGFLRESAKVEENKQGSSCFYAIVGQKADLMIMTLRPTLQEIGEVEVRFNKTRFADFTIPAYSYVSVVELSNYLPQEGKDPLEDPYVRSRLHPVLPKTEHICFYPMDKKREGQDNWYMLPFDQRREMMRSHGMIGRKYSDQVTQLISGSVGLDDWEWGVTLFANDPVVFKKMIYEMRFDEVSARFGEFGSFFVGNRLDEEGLKRYLQV